MKLVFLSFSNRDPFIKTPFSVWSWRFIHSIASKLRQKNYERKWSVRCLPSFWFEQSLFALDFWLVWTNEIFTARRKSNITIKRFSQDEICQFLTKSISHRIPMTLIRLKFDQTKSIRNETIACRTASQKVKEIEGKFMRIVGSQICYCVLKKKLREFLMRCEEKSDKAMKSNNKNKKRP